MEFFFEHDGLHRCSSTWSHPGKHQHAAGPESLGGVQGRESGWSNAFSGDRVLLGNQSAFTGEQFEIWSDHQRVRNGNCLFGVIKAAFVDMSKLISGVLSFWAAARTQLMTPSGSRGMDWDCPTTSHLECFSSLARKATSSCIAQ